MALSTLAQLKHRQLLYGVSTRLSQENIKDMMYLAGIEQRLQESISSGTDVFTWANCYESLLITACGIFRATRIA